MSSAPENFSNPVVPTGSLDSGAADDVSDLRPAGPSLIERLLESFLQERNIRWMLGIGILILLGSSLMFVKNQWHEMQEAWKYLVLLGYTGAIHLCGQTVYHKLNLRKTGTALMAVTLLLIPLVFFSLHWVSAGAAVQTAGLVRLGFLLTSVAFSALAARRILRHFLRGDRPAVLVSYLALSLFGAIAPVLKVSAPGFGWAWALAAWAIFAFGSVRANREVFWLTEEHRLPRIFGFFPIAMFGAQFLAIFTLNFTDAFSNEWLGLGCVLTAIPIMLSADAFARVFKQRTGDLVRPLPWSIIGPVTLGLVLSIVGLAVAGTMFTTKPYALVPTAVLFAFVMAVTAKRTGEQRFGWAMLLGVVLAYQFAPVFFLDLLLRFRAAAASALNETPAKLPYAYYGLTYMPLLFVCSVAARWRRRIADSDVFASPLKHFTLGVSVALLAISFTNPGANLLVAAAMTVFFMWQAFAFRQREAAGLAIIACVTAAVRVVPFVEHVQTIDLPQGASIFALGLTALLMQLVGRWLDAFLDEYTTADSMLPRWFTSWQAAAMPVTLGAVGWWLVTCLPQYSNTPALWSGLLLTGLLAAKAMISPRKGFGEISIGFGLLLFGLHTSAIGLLRKEGLILAYAVVLLVLYVFSRLTQKRTDRFATAFRLPAYYMSHLLILVVAAAGLLSCAVGFRVVGFSMEVAVAGLLGTVWCFAEGRKQRAAVVLGFLSLLAWECGVVREFVDFEWLPVAWAVTSLVLLRYSRRDEQSVLEALSLGLLSVLAVASFVFFKMPMTIAGGIALIGFLMQSAGSDNRSLRGFCLVAMNWQLIGLVFRLMCRDVTTVFDVEAQHMLAASWPVAAIASLSSLLFHHPRLASMKGRDSAVKVSEIFELHFWALSVVSTVFLVFSLMRIPHVLSRLEAVWAVTAFACLAVSTFFSACKSKSEFGVLMSLAVGGFGALYMYCFRVITFGHGVSMFVVLGLACSISLLAKLAGKKEALAFAARPLAQVARLLPMGTVTIALVRYGLGRDSSWLGFNSLAVLMSAAYYFWCGVEEKRNGLIVLAGVIVNFALVLLWHDLKFHDPQFFMIPIGVSVLALVELLKREIPEVMKNPLRYSGALMVLVSPTFNIVNGSWLHVFSLLVCATVVCLVAIGLRIRPLLYAGTAFLIADVIAMVVFGVNDHPDKLWLFGLGAGAAVIALAAFFENQRANVMSRMRLLAAELETWE